MKKAELEAVLVSVNSRLQHITELLNPVALRNLTIAAHTLIELGVDMASRPDLTAIANRRRPSVTTIAKARRRQLTRR